MLQSSAKKDKKNQNSEGGQDQLKPLYVTQDKVDEGGSKSTFKPPQKWNDISRFVKDSNVPKESLRKLRIFKNLSLYIPFHFYGGLPKVLLVSPSSTLAWVTFFSEFLVISYVCKRVRPHVEACVCPSQAERTQKISLVK